MGKMYIRNFKQFYRNQRIKYIKTVIENTRWRKCTNKDGLPEDLSTNDLSFYKFVRVTSVDDADRSFSIYKNLSTDDRGIINTEMKVKSYFSATRVKKKK